MKELIRKLAFELCFDACGFTAGDPPATAQRLFDWLRQGLHGQMAYLQRNAAKRADPRKLLAGAKSIVVVAASYKTLPTSNRSSIENPLAASNDLSIGQIAQYARFADYHELVGQSLEALAARIDGLCGPGTRSQWYVDTGPVLERDLAQQAGLGFFGKHTNLVSRKLGNWFFLGEIITTAELEPDKPERNRCGSCAQCLAACPAQAITAPFLLDARRCISYLTIELKGSIPLELRTVIGNRVFGCDDCLAVCPWNRFATAGKLMLSSVRHDLASPDLAELLRLDETRFKSRFANTPIYRLKHRGLLRNVCVALGNVGDASALPGLSRAASSPEPLVAEHARWAVDQVQARLNNSPRQTDPQPL